MTESRGKQLLILAAKADYLGDLRDRKKISEVQYFAPTEQQAGLEPLQLRDKPAPAASPAWGIS